MAEGRHVQGHVARIVADTKRPWKAFASTALAFAGAMVAAWVADTDPWTAKEIGSAALLAAGASGITGGVTYAVRNPLSTTVPVPAGEQEYVDREDVIPPDNDEDWDT